MKTCTRSFFAFALVAAVATSGFALSDEYVQFGQSAAQFLMTKEELAKWSSVKTDAEAKVFIDAFWGRRDPRLRAEFDRRVKFADETFKELKKRGSLTERGRTYIVFGAPTRITTAAEGTAQPPGTTTNPTRRDDAASVQNPSRQTWRYEADRAKKVFGVDSHVDLLFSDRQGKGEFAMQRPSIDLEAARQRVIDSLFPGAQPVIQPVPVAAAITEFKTPVFQTAVDEFKGGSATLNKSALIAYAEFMSPAGEYFVPVQLFVPKAAGLAADSADTFFAIVEDSSGKRVQLIEAPVTLAATSKSEIVADRTLDALPAGKYTITAGLAKGGQPLVVTSAPLTLAPLDKSEVGVSRLLLLDSVYELNAAAPMKAPFAFGKLKIVPRANLAFTNKDELGYFVEIHNPSVDPGTNLPKLQVRIDLIGPAKTITAPLTEVQALPLSGAVGGGHYAIVNTIPLAELKKPLDKGDYTLKMKIVDMVSQKSYTVEQKFKIVG